MRQISLTDEEASMLDMYFILTGKRIKEELEVWERLKDDPSAPAAESNLRFWKEMQNLITKISNDLRR